MLCFPYAEFLKTKCIFVHKNTFFLCRKNCPVRGEGQLEPWVSDVSACLSKLHYIALQCSAASGYIFLSYKVGKDKWPKKDKRGQKNKVSFLRCSSIPLCVESLIVLADIYISIFSYCFLAFTEALGINMQIRHFLLTNSCLLAPHAKFSLARCIKVLF